ncbi:MAG: hypothetical protein A4E66_02200 [Syntrophus sp. PtaB.Bin001]|nr:MAG: hypothetical protein A4E66_02200 [Syntrophus sp. PtaB.Bin001]
MPNNLNTAAIENDLRLDAQQPCGKLEWLKTSYLNTTDFWRSFKGAFDAHSAAHGISTLYGRYNFYHDIVVRNRNNSSPAFCWYEPSSGIRSISYSELGFLAAAKAGNWARLGVVPGQTLCIIRTIGLEMTVELLAALKTGCRISFLYPQGRSLLQKRLEALKPDHIAIDERHVPLLSAWDELVLKEGDVGKKSHNEREQSFTYLSGQAVFACFNPCGYEPLVPIDVTSDAAYLCALRDGAVALGIGPGKVYAAPGFHLLEIYPALPLAGLLCGATYLHLTPKDIEAKPELVIEKTVKAFGVSKKVRDILLDKQVEVGNSWESWFRNPAESQDLEQWHYFIRHLKLDDSYAFNLRWGAGLGGCSLFSVRRKGMAHMTVLPVPGTAWSLGKLSGGEGLSVTDIGTYALSAPGAPEEEQKATADIIVKNRQEWIFAGVNAVHREGRTFPVEEMLKSLRELGARHGFFCSLVDVPLADPGSGHRIVLLVFRGAATRFDEAWNLKEIRSTITRELGEEYQPDKIDFLPLYPRFLKGVEVDHQWCRDAFLSGALARRLRGDIFPAITRLREVIIKKMKH